MRDGIYESTTAPYIENWCANIAMVRLPRACACFGDNRHRPLDWMQQHTAYMHYVWPMRAGFWFNFKYRVCHRDVPNPCRAAMCALPPLPHAIQKHNCSMVLLRKSKLIGKLILGAESIFDNTHDARGVVEIGLGEQMRMHLFVFIAIEMH